MAKFAFIVNPVGRDGRSLKRWKAIEKILNETVGSQDQIAAAYGGFNKIEFNINGSFKVKKLITKKRSLHNLNKNLLLVYTGIKRTAHDIAKS